MSMRTFVADPDDDEKIQFSRKINKTFLLSLNVHRETLSPASMVPKRLLPFHVCPLAVLNVVKRVENVF